VSLAYERPDRLLVLEYPYFEREEPLVWDEPGTYVETIVFEHNTLMSGTTGSARSSGAAGRRHAAEYARRA